MILIAYDGSDDAKHAIDEAGKLFPGSEAAIVTVWHRLIDTMARTGMSVGVIVDYDEVDSRTEAQATATATEGADLASEGGLKASPVATVVETTVAEALLHTASVHNASAVVLGTRGLSGVKSLVLGSVSHQVLQHADLPIVIVPSPVVAAERAAHRKAA